MENCISASFYGDHQGGHLSPSSKYCRLTCHHTVLACALQWLAWAVLCNTNSCFFSGVCLSSTRACGSLVSHSPWLYLIASSTDHEKQICLSKMPVVKGAMPKVSVSWDVTLNQLLIWTKCPSAAQHSWCRTRFAEHIHPGKKRMHFLWKHIPGEN